MAQMRPQEFCYPEGQARRTSAMTQIITRQEWQQLDVESQLALLQGHAAFWPDDEGEPLHPTEADDGADDDEAVHLTSRLDHGSGRRQFPDYYFEVGPKTVVLHVNPKAFGWIEQVK